MKLNSLNGAQCESHGGRSPDEGAKSLLTYTEKISIGLAVMSNLSMIFTIGFAMTKVWMSNFGLDGRVMGLVSIASMLLQVIVVPFLGHTSDQGMYNVLCFKDLQYWGRRAPVAIASVPWALACAFMQWTPPTDLSYTGVTCWYVGVRVLTVLSWGCAYNSMSIMAFGEVLPSKVERLGVAVLQSIGTSVAYAVACFMTVVAVSVEPGSEDQTTVFTSLGLVNCVLLVFVLPWCFTMRKTVEHKRAAVSLNPIADLCQTLAYNPGFRSIVHFVFLFMGAVWMQIGLLPFFLETVVGYSRKEVAKITGSCMVMLIIGRAASIPITKVLLADKDDGCLGFAVHPSRLLCCAVLWSACVWSALLAMAVEHKHDRKLGWILCACNAFQAGLLGPVYEMSMRILNTWVIDLDLVQVAEKTGDVDGCVRRDGHFQSLALTVSNFAWVWLGIVQFILGSVGFKGDDSASSDDAGVEQPEAAVMAIYVIYVFVAPAMWVVGCYFLFWYPIKGEQLLKLRQRYAVLFERKRSTVLVQSGAQKNTSPEPSQANEQPNLAEEKNVIDRETEPSATSEREKIDRPTGSPADETLERAEDEAKGIGEGHSEESERGNSHASTTLARESESNFALEEECKEESGLAGPTSQAEIDEQPVVEVDKQPLSSFYSL